MRETQSRSKIRVQSLGGSIPGSGRSPGEGSGNPLQYSCLKNPMDQGAWQATVHGVTNSWTRLSDFTFHFHFFWDYLPHGVVEGLHESSHWENSIETCILHMRADLQSRLDAWDRVLRAGTLGWPRGMGWRGRWEGGSGWGTHVHPWLSHVNVWQKPAQYCKVISLQLKQKKFF